MDVGTGPSRRAVLGSAGALLGGFLSTTFTPAARDTTLIPPPLTAVTDPTLLLSEPIYADIQWNPDSPIRPRQADLANWWLLGSSTAEFASAHVARLARERDKTLWMDAKAGETDAQIAARMGLAPARLTFPADTVLPGEGRRTWAVACEISSPASRTYPGRIEGTGVYGTLGWDRLRAVPRFVRTDNGPRATVPPNSRFLPTEAPARRADLGLFLGGGKNSITVRRVRAEDVTAGWVAQHEWLVPQHAAFLRAGFFNNTGTDPSDSVHVNVRAVNAWGRETLGPRFLDLGAWVTDARVWDLVRLVPTDIDRDQQRKGNLPPSISDRAGRHLTDLAAKAWIDDQLASRLTELGWA